MKRKVLLTGGNGFFGSRFKRHCSDRFDIIATDVNELDILDAGAVRAAFHLVRPDFVIHAAAIAVTDWCNQNPEKARAINVEGALNVGRAASETGAGMVFLSSEQVFNGRHDGGPFSEDDKPEPNTVYGANKLEAEGLLAGITEKLWVLRFTWMFGVPQRGLPVVNNILWDTYRSILAGKPVTASRREFRGLTDIDELIDRFPAVFELPYGTWHTGARNDRSRYDIVESIFRDLGLESRIPELLREDTQKYLDAPRDVRLDTGKEANAGICFTESTEALARCIRDYSLAVRQ